MLATDYSREHRFLTDKRKKLSTQIQAEFDSKQIKLIDADILHSKNINGAGGTTNLLESTNDKITGVSDFNGETLEAGVNVAVGKIKLGYAKAPQADNKTAADVVYSSNIADFPVELLRASLIVRQDGKTLLRLPVERFTTKANSVKVQGEEDAVYLTSPILLIENKKIEILLEFASGKGIVTGTDDHFVQVRFMGTQTISK